MRNVTYAYLGPEESAGRYGKKGTASDVTLWNAKSGDAYLNLVTPTRYPDKLTSLLTALDLADAVVLHPARVDRVLGETVVGAGLFGRTRGFLRAGPEAPIESVQPLLARTALKDLEPNAEPEGAFRERLLALATTATGGPTIVPVDHAFPVKGVGTVVLALVRSGEVRVHQNLQAFPGTKTMEVRSIQVHDVDQPQATTGSRVGLAIKGVEAGDLPRGTVLAPPDALRVIPTGETVPLTLRASSFNKWTPRPGAVVHLFHALQDIPLRIESVAAPSADAVELAARLEAGLARVPGAPAVLVDLDNKVQRFIGRVDWPG